MNPQRRSRRPRRSGKPSGPSKSSVEPLHPTDDVPDIESFDEWDLGEDILESIRAMGIETPTPIQKLAIQPVLDGRDVIAKAETGTGKTLAFGAPMMAKIDPDRSSVLGLILCPTRELAQQVAGTIELLGKPRSLSVALVVGGEPAQGQVYALKAGAQIVVGTPGRVLDLYGQGFLSFPWTEFVVLDEADEMLEIGFLDDVRKILSYTPDERQTLLFSATFPDELLKLAREKTREPVEIATAKGVATVSTIDQRFIPVEGERALVLTRLIERSDPTDVFLVFCDRRTEVDRLMRRLERMPFSVKALHGGYDQASRFRVMSAFRTGDVKALIATDVASRGLDVVHVTHVVNYSVPNDISDYTHRIGRTGRAGRKGQAITLVADEQVRRWRSIQRDARWEIAEMDSPGRTRQDRPSSRSDSRSDSRSAPRSEARSEARSGERSGDRRGRRGERSGRDEARAPRRDRDRSTERGDRAASSQRVEGRTRREESTRERVARERREAAGETGEAGAERRPTSAREDESDRSPPRRRRSSRSSRGRSGEATRSDQD